MDIITEISKRGRRFKLRKSKLISLVYGGASSLESFLSLSPSLNLLPLEPPRDLRSVDELPRLHSRRKISPTPSGTTWFVCLSSSKSVKECLDGLLQTVNRYGYAMLVLLIVKFLAVLSSLKALRLIQ
uniref:Uncharacterized protein n=1 Tax=Brassica oleracea TaxID=3712 RepID=A0A3P6C9F8_BRAOL|nr:unnamed protein product [Brassica oleracea]